MSKWTQQNLRHKIIILYYSIYSFGLVTKSSFGLVTKSYNHQNSPWGTQQYTGDLRALNFG